ncbi:MAG: GNAT family protein [bacterium]
MKRQGDDRASEWPESRFQGRLVRLRAREPEDEALLFEWFNDPDVTEHLSMRYPISHKGEREFLVRSADVGYNNINFAIETLTDGTMIGGCDLHRVSAENRSGVLGIAIGDKAFWDGGYGTDAMRTLVRFGFDMLNLHRIELDVYANNLRAQHVYEKIGFQFEARKRKAIYKFGEYQDVLVMGILEGELRLDD